MDVFEAVRAPFAGVTSNFAAQVGTTHAVYVVPDDWKNRRVDITVRAAALNSAGLAASVWISFGTSASMEVSRTQFVSGTPPAWTSDAKVGRPVRDGETVDRLIPNETTHFSIESDTANTEVYIHLSDFVDPNALTANVSASEL